MKPLTLPHPTRAPRSPWYDPGRELERVRIAKETQEWLSARMLRTVPREVVTVEQLQEMCRSGARESKNGRMLAAFEVTGR